MKKRTILSVIFALTMVLVPISIYAVNYYPSDHKGLLPKCNEGPIDAVTGDYSNPCGFDSLMAMINKLIDFVTLQLATPLFAVIFIFAGVLYLSAGAKPDNKTKAKKIIFNSLKGFGLVLASWVIVKTILLTLGYHGPWFL